jgi:beta-glucosidase-like glycosyl hydrolase
MHQIFQSKQDLINYLNTNNMSPFIIGLKSTTLSQEEIDLISILKPFGFILFSRNIDHSSQTQLKEYIQSIKDLYKNCEPIITIDQEGGRVQRIKEPLCKKFPSSLELMSSDNTNLEEAVYDNYYEIGTNLKNFGFNMNFAPLADLYYEYANKIIGDRSFGNNIKEVVSMSKAAAEGLLDAGIIPVIKHIPGHGRATLDSHIDLPVIDTSLDELEKTDFLVFKNLGKNFVFAMTAHIVFNALDHELPVTLSSKCMSYIKNKLLYQNSIIISDDLNMKALYQNNNLSFNEIVSNTLKVCDIALYCEYNIENLKNLSLV